jgi:hypothetical protein
VVDVAGIAEAFSVLLGRSWPTPALDDALARIRVARSIDEVRARLRTIFSRVHAQHGGVHLWCKDEGSNFLAVCSRFVAASGLDEGVLLSGINDYDPRLPWTRQAGIDIRDDREVFRSGSPKLDIVERQDREGETIWLKTSKVPCGTTGAMAGGTVGGFSVISTEDAVALSRGR